ncbi:MAG: T9SS type A sorting domain-containing protein, partial [Flavobacteriales bacterium]|nr:T9SS type A sorting domain-containing protein [Flavobacteriales bacterium]
SESTVNINTSTITSNLAGLKGGGIYVESNSNISSSSQVKLINTTMVYNGGGVYNYTTSPGLDTSEMIIESSILALNGTSLFSDTLISLGYNVFSDATVLGSIITDQLNVDSMMLNLGSLQNNGGLTFTLIPGVGSVAVDMGSPSDFSDAQNNSITGIRDVGAAESGITVEVSKNEIITNFNIYPNPNNGKFEVLIDDVQGEVMLELINLLGEVVYKDTGKKSKYSFDLTNQSKGVYFLKIKVGAKRGMQKIIFQ